MESTARSIPARSQRRLPPIRYVLVAWLMILSAVAYLDRTNTSVAGIQIGREFGISNTQLGWVFSAFLIGYAAFQVPAGLLAHRFGPRLLLTFAVLWWGVFTSLTALVPAHIFGAVAVFIFVRFALGAGEATMYPAATQFVERWFPPAERGKANGIIFGGVGLGSGITPPLVTAIVLHFGWRASFWFSALVGILAGLLWFFTSRDTPEAHPWVNDAERALIAAGREPELAASRKRSRIPWLRILGSKEIAALTISYFAFGYVAWIFFGWFYIYMAEARGVNLQSSALYATLPFVGMTIGCLLGGVASDMLARICGLRVGRCIMPAAAMAATALLLLAGSRATDTHAAGLVLACGAGMLYVAQSCFWAISADFAGSYAGLVSGIMNMGAQIGGAVTASLTPFIAARFGWMAAFSIAAALALIGAACWLAVNPNRRLFEPGISEYESD